MVFDSKCGRQWYGVTVKVGRVQILPDTTGTRGEPQTHGSFPPEVLMVAENAQYWREILEARRLLRSGAIGQVLSVRAPWPGERVRGVRVFSFLPRGPGGFLVSRRIQANRGALKKDTPTCAFVTF